MVDYKGPLERIGNRISPTLDLDRIARRLQRRKARRRFGVALLALMIAGTGMGGAYLAFGGSPAIRSSGRCETLIPQCTMERLPNRTLSGNRHEGALGPVSGDPEGIISFDEALVRAWAEDGRGDAEAVQVVLGSADPQELHWETDSTLFYGVTWFGTCVISGSRSATPRPVECARTEWSTVIDAYTGAFIGGGTS